MYIFKYIYVIYVCSVCKCVYVGHVPVIREFTSH